MEQAKLLKAAHEALKSAMPVIGEDGTSQNGLAALADKVAKATVLDDNAQAVVTATGSVSKDDVVALTWELSARGEELILANQGAKLLDACTARMNGDLTHTELYSVLVFAQGGKTWIKSMMADAAGNWKFGATQEFSEVELSAVSLVPFQTTVDPYYNGTPYFAVLYREAEFGMVKIYARDWRDDSLALCGTDLWTDDEPYNIIGAWAPEMWHEYFGNTSYDGGRIAISWLNKEGEWHLCSLGLVPHWDEANGHYYSTEIKQTRLITAGEHEGIDYIDAGFEGGLKKYGTKTSKAFVIPAWDTDEYLSPGAWCMASHTTRHGETIVFPGADGKRYLLSFISATDNSFKEVPEVGTPRVLELAPISCVPLALQGAVMAGAVVTEVNMDLPCFGRSACTHIITALAKGSSSARPSLAMESWACGYEFEPTNLWFCDHAEKGSSLGLLSAARCGHNNDRFVVGYAMDGIYRAVVFYGRGGEFFAGPELELKHIDTAARLVEATNGSVSLLRQKDGVIYVQRYGLEQVVERVDSKDLADAVAVTSGRPGQTIKIRALE